MQELLHNISQCTICKAHLPLGPNPILSAHKNSKIILLSQAPGRIAHEKSKAWDDPGGRQLRKWLNVSEAQFYNPENFAIVPIGFCYPGKAKTGDLPPRPECAPQWHQQLLDKMGHVELIILIGAYAQNYYLNDKKNLTERVGNYKDYLPTYFPIPHPSPTNRFWRSKNPWFEELVVPELRNVVSNLILS
ncbi:uracil-DNA glycosylase family protein [Winogradskyella forsetii]|uniref:uracil-DNA glycosylase family protein n=1 Tax=Winogradskyella forsetii TaxID=2686077 RepID=UPI0015C10F7C|nr:uracil-DNA glycosylase family protein [Winogradskyella forsetii]